MRRFSPRRVPSLQDRSNAWSGGLFGNTLDDQDDQTEQSFLDRILIVACQTKWPDSPTVVMEDSVSDTRQWDAMCNFRTA